MKEIYFCALTPNTNTNTCQIFSLINSIIHAFNENKKCIIIDKFNNDILNSNNVSKISDIIDINQLNNFLLENYQMIIVDKEDIDFKINSIKYGHLNKNIDLTKEIIDNYFHRKNLLVTTDVNLNLLKGEDPIPNQAKYVYINYSINNIPIEEIYEELDCVLKEPIIFNLETNNFIYKLMNLSSLFNKNMFDHILQNIVYTNTFDQIIYNFKETNQIENQPINMVEVCILNNKNKNTLLENKYIQLIQKYISKEENILLFISNNTDNIVFNKVLQFLQQNGYKVILYKYLPVIGSEINNIIKINIGKLCSNMFIGNFNRQLMSGSPFTYILMNQMNPNVKHVLVDTEDITKEEETNFISSF